MDYELGRVFDALREAGRWERTLVVVTGDHGELLGERGEWGHERFLWEPLLRVPLIVKPAAPARPGRRVAGLVSLVDVLPLVLEAVGIEPPPGVQGRTRPDPDRAVLAEVHPSSSDRNTGVWRARWQGDRKTISTSFGEHYLFDLSADPGESTNLAQVDVAAADRALEELHRDFEALPAAADEAPTVEVDRETLEALRRLGYVEDPESP